MRKQESPLALAREKNNIIRLLSSVRAWIKVLSTILVLVFGWLKLRGISILPLTTDASATFLLMATMIIYYFSWVFGSLIDAHDQALAYLSAPRAGRIPLLGMGLMVIITLGFGVLCWVDTYGQFVVALACFWSLNIIAWVYYLKAIALPMSKVTRSLMPNEDDHLDLVRLEVVEDFVLGHWQWWRFGIGSALIGCSMIMAFTPVAHIVRIKSGMHSDDLVVVLSIFVSVVLVESWIWLKRIRRRVSLDLLDSLSPEYHLSRRPNKESVSTI